MVRKIICGPGFSAVTEDGVLVEYIPDDLTDQDMFRFREAYEDICRHAYRDAGLISKIYYMYIMVL